jgi:starch phosphorylase
VPDKYEAERRDSEEARELYEILQDQVLPMYYGQAHSSGAPEWIRMAKHSMATILPRFNATRMVTEYVSKFYVPAAARGQRFNDTQLDNARELASWKARVREAWPKVGLWRVDPPQASITFGDRITIEVDVELGGLRPEDLMVELLLSRSDRNPDQPELEQHRLEPQPHTPGSPQRYRLVFAPDLCGKLDYRLRAYPHRTELAHSFELGLMRWV